MKKLNNENQVKINATRTDTNSKGKSQTHKLNKMATTDYVYSSADRIPFGVVY